MSHILNVAYGVENVFPDLFIYKTVSIQENPEADLLQHLPECCHFIQRARAEVRGRAQDDRLLVSRLFVT